VFLIQHRVGSHAAKKINKCMIANTLFQHQKLWKRGLAERNDDDG
jgi:hypothetical protein